MSISQVQRKNILNFIARSQYASGVHPPLNDIIKPLATFFGQTSVGLPYRLPLNRFRDDLKSSEDDYNDLLAFMIANLDTLYETCFDQIDQILVLNTVLQNHLDRLKRKRAKLEDQIDDYLLGIYNSDGYFYSVSDNFSQTDLVDFSYTSAYIDTEAGIAMLPTLAQGSRVIPIDKLAVPNIDIRNNQNKQYGYDTKMPFSNAVDGLTNTAWYVEVKTKDNVPLTMNLAIDLSTALGNTKITKIELTPYGIKPVKAAVSVRYIDEDELSGPQPFSSVVKTSGDKMVFNADNNNADVEQLVFQLSKKEYDYQITDHNGTHNVYIFGIKELLITENVYDQQATVVSHPLTLPVGLAEESSIDGVSLVVQDSVPPNTSISYYVAEDNTDATTIDDFDWRPISPIGWIQGDKNVVVRFGGAKYRTFNIRSIPRNTSENEIQLIEHDDDNIDLARRNPTSSYFLGLDVYRIAPFSDEFLSGTLSLEEGVNTTRIYYADYNARAMTESFALWKEIFDSGEYETTYGQIDTGKGFFWGGDVGSNAKSVYVETYIDCDQDMPVIQKDCLKMDANSQTWDLKLYLNGREIASLPPGINKATVPWKFNRGRNHVALLVNIPSASGSTTPYTGVFQVMSNDSLANYGNVNLDWLTYVDNYKFSTNQLDDAKTFTIYNQELITRRKTTDNYRLTYYQQTNAGPDAIRLRADLSRTENDTHISPILDSYRVRFSYERDTE